MQPSNLYEDAYVYAVLSRSLPVLHSLTASEYLRAKQFRQPHPLAIRFFRLIQNPNYLWLLHYIIVLALHEHTL